MAICDNGNAVVLPRKVAGHWTQPIAAYHVIAGLVPHETSTTPWLASLRIATFLTELLAKPGRRFVWPFTSPFSSLCRYWNPSEVGLRSIAVASPLGVCGVVEKTPTCTSIASRNWGETRTVEPRVGQACYLASLIRRARWQVYTDCVCLCELPCGAWTTLGKKYTRHQGRQTDMQNVL